VDWEILHEISGQKINQNYTVYIHVYISFTHNKYTLISHERGKGRNMITTIGTYSWSKIMQ